MQKIPCALAQGIFHIRYSVGGARLHRGLLALNVLVNGLCSSLACAHGLDDGGCAGHGIAAGVHTIAAGFAVVAVGNDAAVLYAVTWMPLYIAIPFTLLVTVLIGFLIERVAYKPLRTAPRMSVMISAIGVSYLLQNVALYVTGGLAKMYPTIPWISNTVTIGTATTKVVTIITPILTLVLVIALVTFIQKTKIGMAMRAVSKDFETSQLMGIKINNVISATFIIGSFLAAVGSLLYFTNYAAVIPTSGAMPGLKAFVAAVFGGIGSIPGAVIGAFIIGICENIIKGLGWTTFSDAFTFALLIIILIVKPTGLFGEKANEKV